MGVKSDDLAGQEIGPRFRSIELRIFGLGNHAQYLWYRMEPCHVDTTYFARHVLEQRLKKSVTLSRERLVISARPVDMVASKVPEQIVTNDSRPYIDGKMMLRSVTSGTMRVVVSPAM